MGLFNRLGRGLKRAPGALALSAALLSGCEPAPGVPGPRGDAQTAVADVLGDLPVDFGVPDSEPDTADASSDASMPDAAPDAQTPQPPLEPPVASVCTTIRLFGGSEETLRTLAEGAETLGLPNLREDLTRCLDQTPVVLNPLLIGDLTELLRLRLDAVVALREHLSEDDFDADAPEFEQFRTDLSFVDTVISDFLSAHGLEISVTGFEENNPGNGSIRVVIEGIAMLSEGGGLLFDDAGCTSVYYGSEGPGPLVHRTQVLTTCRAEGPGNTEVFGKIEMTLAEYTPEQDDSVPSLEKSCPADAVERGGTEILRGYLSGRTSRSGTLTISDFFTFFVRRTPDNGGPSTFVAADHRSSDGYVDHGFFDQNQSVLCTDWGGLNPGSNVGQHAAAAFRVIDGASPVASAMNELVEVLTIMNTPENADALAFVPGGPFTFGHDADEPTYDGFVRRVQEAELWMIYDRLFPGQPEDQADR